MAATPSDAGRYRRQQRRRALIGAGGGLIVIALVVLSIVLSQNDHHQEQVRSFSVPYGETMTSAEYREIGKGEDEAEVLTRLDKTGRPESLTKNYVLVLFPAPAASASCTYWEFSDRPEIFARLCFDRSSGELVQKLMEDVRAGAAPGGALVARPL